MTPIHAAAIEQEFALASALMLQGNFSAAFTHLERAHVLGQTRVLPHVRSHWQMLKLEFARRRPLAVLGQGVRLVLAALGSAAGIVPTGNTGGTDVSMFRRMPIDPQLAALMQGEANTASPEAPPRRLAGKAVALFAGMLIGALIYGYAPELLRTRSDQPPLNFVAASERLHTSGQPSRVQLAGLKDSGYALVINLSPPTTIDAIADEGMLVAGTGIGYMNIPVDFRRPRIEDFDLFSSVIGQSGIRQVLVHCQINRRASMFAFLYQVVHQGADPDQAYARVTDIWVPDEQWKDFARKVLKRSGIDFEPY